MLRKISCGVILIFITQVLSGSSAFSKNDASIQVKGSDTMVNLVQSWAEEFMKENPQVFVAVTGGGSGTGFAALINKSCDLAMASREIKSQEIKLAEVKGVKPMEFKVALDGLAVVVNPKNPVGKLTLDELAGVFTGKIKNWKELGGADAGIVILSREVNSGTHVYFKEHVLRKGDAKSREEFSPDALLLPSSQAIADEVKQNTAAIGYYGMGYISKDQKAVWVAKNASSDYVPPKMNEITSGHYPISRPLYLYTNGEPSEKLKGFIDFVLADKGQAIVERMDFVPIKK